jgi:hypothetical protein
MATKDEGEQAEGSRSGSSARRSSASSTATTSTHSPMNTNMAAGDPNPSEHTPQIAGQEVTYASDPKEADTFRNPVVLKGPDDPNDPGQNLVIVGEDQIREFHHPGSKRISRQVIMAAGTLTTRRLAEEAGVKSFKEYQP